jgi:predicted phage baseplate assembly protein
LGFYETTLLPLPQPGHPEPVVDLNDPLVLDNALYLALLAPKNVDPDQVRSAIAHQTLSLGVVPALGDAIAPLLPQRPGVRRPPLPSLVYEIPDPSASGVRYRRLKEQRTPPVLNQVGVVQLGLPAATALTTWSFDRPTDEGTGALPPRIEDEDIQRRLVTWLRLRLPSANGSEDATARNARLSWVGVNATTVSQAVPVVAEPLGQGNGQPDQEFRLANTPVIPDSLRLEVTDPAGVFRLWRLTDDLLAAGPDDEVFALDPEAGLVRFGGPRGARPALGTRLRASYRYGGGTAGNVGIGAIQASPDPRLQGGYQIANPVPTWGGDTGETVAEAERNLPLHLRHRDRLVTDADFRDVTWRAPGVDLGRVEVLPLFRPGDPESAPGAVTLLVVPRHDPVRPRWPTPDRLFLRAICEYLAPRRLITTELHVRGPTYVSVQVSTGIQVRAGHFPDQVVQAVHNRLDEYLSALPPGGPDRQGWPLAKKLLRKDLEAVVARVTGVDFVESLELGAKGALGIEDQPLTGLELPVLTALAVREGAAEPLAEVVGTAPEQPPVVDIHPVPVSKATC